MRAREQPLVQIVIKERLKSCFTSLSHTWSRGSERLPEATQRGDRELSTILRVSRMIVIEKIYY